MSGTRAGSMKAVATIYRKHGKNFFREAGRAGGTKSRGGGFAARINCLCDEIPAKHHKAQCAGATGGRISRRRSKNTGGGR